MKMRLVSLSMALALAGTLAAQNAALQTSKEELTGILQRLNRQPAEESHMNNPGWVDANIQRELRIFAKLNAGTEEALTAEVWLAVGELESAQSERVASRKEKAKAQSATLSALAKRGTNTWHGKVARLARTGALLTASDYDGLQSQVAEILSSVDTYRSEKDEQFQSYLKAMRVESKDLEPNLRRMLVIAACHANKLDEALKHALELKAKFPEWATWQQVDDIIDQLSKGQSPYRQRK